MSNEPKQAEEARQDGAEVDADGKLVVPAWKKLPTAVVYLDVHGAIVNEVSECRIQSYGAPYYVAHAHYRMNGDERTGTREYLLTRSQIPLLLQMRPVKGYPHSVARIFRYGVEQIL